MNESAQIHARLVSHSMLVTLTAEISRPTSAPAQVSSTDLNCTAGVLRLSPQNPLAPCGRGGMTGECVFRRRLSNMRWQSKRRTQPKKQNCHGLTASWGSRREVCEVRGEEALGGGKNSPERPGGRSVDRDRRALLGAAQSRLNPILFITPKLNKVGPQFSLTPSVKLGAPPLLPRSHLTF